MTTREQIRAIVANESLSDLEKIGALRKLVPAELRFFPFANFNQLPIELVEPFERALEVAQASHRITNQAIADKIQEN